VVGVVVAGVGVVVVGVGAVGVMACRGPVTLSGNRPQSTVPATTVASSALTGS
jgi:hypothetical protein